MQRCKLWLLLATADGLTTRDSVGRRVFPSLVPASIPAQPVPNCSATSSTAGCLALPTTALPVRPAWAGTLHSTHGVTCPANASGDRSCILGLPAGRNDSTLMLQSKGALHYYLKSDARTLQCGSAMCPPLVTEQEQNDAGQSSTITFALGDLNKDGFVDVVMGRSSPGASNSAAVPFLALGAANGAFQAVQAVSIGNCQKGEHVALGDVNNDGWYAPLRRPRGSARARTHASAPLPKKLRGPSQPDVLRRPSPVTVARLDLVVLDKGGADDYLLLWEPSNKGFGTATVLPRAQSGGTGTLSNALKNSLLLADVNGDGQSHTCLSSPGVGEPHRSLHLLSTPHSCLQAGWTFSSSLRVISAQSRS